MRNGINRLSRSLRSAVASILATAFCLLAFTVMSSQSGFAIAAFARKYGLPCSACHDAWPKLNNFGQTFKDNGYQLMNDRDAPIWQNPSYWPVAFRITPYWHSDSNNRTATDQAAAGYQTVTVQGFNLSGLDILTGGTLNKNVSFLLTPSSDETASFHFESAWVRFDNIFNSSWANLKMGKFELDNVISEKRILTLSSQGGLYQFYHFLPYGDSNPYGWGMGDNQIGLEYMGHSKNDYNRVSASLLSSVDGNVDNPNGNTYDGFFAASTAFNAGSLGLQRVGGFAYIGQAPTYFLSTGGVPIAGAGRGNKGFSREGVYGLFYFGKFDVTPMWAHGSESAYLANYTPSTGPLPAGSHSPAWNDGMVEAHWLPNPQFVLTYRFEAIRMSQQANDAYPDDAGNLNANTIAFRYYPFMHSRAGFAFHGEYSRVNQKHVFTSGPNLLDQTYNTVFGGWDFIF